MNTNIGTVSFTIPPNDIASVLKSQLLTFIITGDNGLIEFIGVQASKPIAILLAENYVLIDDKLRWTGTVHALSYMVQVEKHGIPVKPAELQKEKYDALLRSLLLD
jgi:hypothetical protein